MNTATRTAFGGLCAISAGIALHASPLYAESKVRKPIYDTQERQSGQQEVVFDRYHQLESRIRSGREWLAVHAHYAGHEIDSLLDGYFHFERAATSTIASLEPKGDERVLEGTIYTGVSAMASSIMVRNRSFPIRLVTPVAVGIAALNYFLPEISHNLGGLVWRYEQRMPQVAQTHAAIRDGVREAVETTSTTIEESRRTIDGAVKDTRKFVEDNTDLKLDSSKK